MKNLLAKLGNDKDDPKYVRNELYLGNRKIIVGDGKADLVLETLGKVYIKSGRNNVLLNDLFKLLKEKTINADINDIVKSIIIVSSTDELKNMEYPGDGRFVYDSTNKILYISIFNLYVALVNARLDVENTYVKKSGDTMSGQLEIKTPYAPLIVHSTSMVKNLNAEMVGGYKSSEIAKIYKNEYILGEWKFGKHCESLNTWKFHKNISLLSDLVSYGSLSSPQFASGFSGYGWRLDGTTNTLTIDNLVVRKLMMVYEMVINKISATNGSIWVSNSCKCESATKLTFIDNLIDTINISILYVESSKHIEVVTISGLRKGYFVLSQINDNSINTHIEGKNLSSNLYFGSAATFREITYVYNITNIDAFNSLLTHYLNAKLTEQYPTAVEATLEIKDSVNQWVYDVLIVPSNIGSVIKGILSLLVRDPKATTLDYIHLNTSFLALTLSQTDPVDIKVYYKYFGAPVLGDEFVNNYWIVNTDKEEYSLFLVGDLLRCLKMVDSGNIKYYDALVVSKLADRTFLVQKALSIFDMHSEVTYDELGNVVIKNQYNDLYQTGDEVYLRDDSGDIVYDDNGDPVMDPSKIIADIQEKDDLILIGNILNVNRLGAVYLTSSDNMSPYIDVISKIDRPDYSVIYRKPRWIMYKQYYVSQYPSDALLGTFRVDRHTNLILGRALVTDVSDESLSWDLLVLYGHETPSSKCLAQRIVVKNADGEPLKDAQGNYIYTLLEDPTPISSTRIGRLDGIHDSIFSNNLPNGYGLYANNVFLTGEFYLNNGKSIASFADDITLLSGKIESIDLDALKQSIIDAVGKLIPDKESLGIAGIMTYPLEGGRHGLAVLGDLISFWDSKTSIETGDPTMLILNGRINADLIDVKELEFDKLVGKGLYLQSVVKSIKMSGTLSNINNEQKTFTNALIVGTPKEITNTLYAPNVPDNAITKDGYKRILHLKDFYILYDRKYYRIYLAQVSEGELMTFKYVYLEEESPKYISIPENITQVDESTIQEVQFISLVDIGDTEYDIMHINSFGKGEQILLYPDGTVMNAKIIVKNNNGHPKSCIEYFFSPGVITEKVLLNEGDAYVVNKFMDGDEFSEKYTGGLLKRINYFAKNIMVAYELVKMEDYKISDWTTYLDGRITYPDNPTYSDIYDIFVEMKKTLKRDPTKGVWNTQYGFLLGDIRSKRQDHGTTIESKFIYVGDGEDVLLWEDGTATYPGHYIYANSSAESYVKSLLKLGTTEIPTSKKTTLESYMYKPDDSDNIIDVLFVSKCDIKQPGGTGNACSITITYIEQHATPDEQNSTISREDIVFDLDEDGNYVQSNEIVNELVL